MNSLEIHIEEIKTLFFQVLDILDNLNDSNFDNRMKTVKANMDEVNLIKEKLQRQYPKDELSKYEESLFKLAKQIQEKFDNIIKLKILEKDRIALELEQLKNKKKLQNYRR